MLDKRTENIYSLPCYFLPESELEEIKVLYKSKYNLEVTEAQKVWVSVTVSGAEHENMTRMSAKAIRITAASGVSNPGALAAVDPAYAAIAPIATAQVAASVLVSSHENMTRMSAKAIRIGDFWYMYAGSMYTPGLFGS